MVSPRGLLKRFLETQMEGLTGHIEQCGYPFDSVMWSKEDFTTTNGTPTWWVYEQTAYWFDGYLRASILLNDEKRIKECEKIVNKVIDQADKEGYLGPSNLKIGMATRWPHVVFFRACFALYEYNKDEKILEALTKHYLNGTYRYRFFRDVMNVEIMLYVYFETKDKRLLDLAVESYEDYNKMKIRFNQINDDLILSGRRPYIHGVTYNEYSKLGALLYKATGKEKYLKVSIKAFDTLNKKFMLPGQCNCSCEYTISDYYMECYETCDITDYTWANNIMLKVTKNSEYGDRIEKCIFNAGMGSVLENFKGLQYFSCANQFVLDKSSCHCQFSKGKKWMSYRPNPGTECCAGNVNRFMPNYVWNMYHKENDNIFVNLFGASVYETTVDNKKITISQDTKYPFSEKINFNIETETEFYLNIRVPKFAKNFSIKIDQLEVYGNEKDYCNLKISRNCSVFVTFDTDIEEINTKNGGVYFVKGVLVYSYGMLGNREIDHSEERSSKEFPAYNIYADKEWGYEIVGDANPKFYPGSAEIFDLREDLPSIEIDAYKILNSNIINRRTLTITHTDLFGVKRKRTEKGDFKLTPDLLKTKTILEKNSKKVMLYPYGACKIRETVFGKRK